MTDQELRKWCLEQAFVRRELMNVPHMHVVNVAAEYYAWIVEGTYHLGPREAQEK